MVANKTPLALRSCFRFKKIKNAARFKIAPILITLPILPCSRITFQADSIVRLDTLAEYMLYKYIPVKVAMTPTINPIIISFFDLINFMI